MDDWLMPTAHKCINGITILWNPMETVLWIIIEQVSYQICNIMSFLANPDYYLFCKKKKKEHTHNHMYF